MKYFWPVISAIFNVATVVGLGAAWALGIVTIFGIYAEDGVSFFTVIFTLLIAILLANYIHDAIKGVKKAGGDDRS